MAKAEYPIFLSYIFLTSWFVYGLGRVTSFLTFYSLPPPFFLLSSFFLFQQSSLSNICSPTFVHSQLSLLKPPHSASFTSLSLTIIEIIIL